jgi:hypothetical protein
VTRGSVIASIALVLFVLASPSANAKQRTDPEASSPAGVIYEIPFDTARKDAAPKSARQGGQDSGTSAGSAAAGAAGSTGGGGSGGGGSGSGSSGATSGSASSGGSGSGGGAANGSASDDPNVGTSIHSENGFGSSSQVPGVAGATVASDGPPSSALRTASAGDEPSSVLTFGLVVLVALVGGWIGVAASRHLRNE